MSWEISAEKIKITGTSPEVEIGGTNPKISIVKSGGPTITLNNSVAGNFTAASGYAVSTITNITVDSTTIIVFSPVNSAAALSVRSHSPFISAVHPGSGFAFSTLTASFFGGTESFNYFLFK